MGEIFEKACSLTVLGEAWKRVGAKKAAGLRERKAKALFSANA